MDDEDFKANVMRGFEAIEERLGAIAADAEADLAHIDRRLDAVVARLEEQDVAHDRLVEKVDRVSLAVRQGLEASEQALSAITPLSRRVSKLEHPGED